MILIATDEAGYGPKLGPLVICGTAWLLPKTEDGELVARFKPIAGPQKRGDQTIVVDDSKAVYQAKSKSVSDGLAKLHSIAEIANHCLNGPANLADWLQTFAAQDNDTLSETPWLQESSSVEFDTNQDVDAVANAWSQNGAKLIGMQLRIITAERFNQACENGFNKSDLLSEATLRIVCGLLNQQNVNDKTTRIFCDRHGGRRYYAGVLQHVFPDSQVLVTNETKSVSRYQLRHRGSDCTVDFTVKGDTFTPVALSSLIAKYIRERMMQRFNTYFSKLSEHGSDLRPTAGYPVDADRFLSDVESVITTQGIRISQLVRQR